MLHGGRLQPGLRKSWTSQFIIGKTDTPGLHKFIPAQAWKMKLGIRTAPLPPVIHHVGSKKGAGPCNIMHPIHLAIRPCIGKATRKTVVAQLWYTEQGMNAPHVRLPQEACNHISNTKPFLEAVKCSHVQPVTWRLRNMGWWRNSWSESLPVSLFPWRSLHAAKCTAAVRIMRISAGTICTSQSVILTGPQWLESRLDAMKE